MLSTAASATDNTREVQETNSACLTCLAPQLRAIMAVAATETPIRMACTRKNTRWPVVTAATEVVPNWATILMCTKPTVVNSRLEMIVGHANRQTYLLVEYGVLGGETDTSISR